MSEKLQYLKNLNLLDSKAPCSRISSENKTITYEDKSIYSGAINKASRESSSAIYTYTDGSTYQGGFKEGQKDG
jgi:hypothetical protein